MAILSERDRGIIKNRFDKELADEVRLCFVADGDGSPVVAGQPSPSESVREEQQLLDELAALSPKLTVERRDLHDEADRSRIAAWGVDRGPALIVSRDGHLGVRYFGLTSGYEFAALIEDIVEVSRNRTTLSAATQQALAAIAKPVHIRVFVTPT